MELPKNADINEYIIELIEGKQPPYGSIHTFTLVELETLKVYIKTHLKIGSIWPFKSLIDALILFDQKSDSSLRLCIDYQGLNNLRIKNWYLLSLIVEILDHLG